MSETGFYALGTWGTEAGRVAAIARHIPDAVVYVIGRAAIKHLFGFHGITTVAARCPRPGCVEPSGADRQSWLRQRNPDRLVMDGFAYGGRLHECRSYIAARPRPTYYLHRASSLSPVFEPRHFAAVLKPEPADVGGVDLYPILAFDADELPTRAEARAALGGGTRPLVLIIGEGTTPHYGDYVRGLCRRHGLDHVTVATYPVMPLMAGADLIVGYAGHSQIEAEAVGVPMAAIANLADPTQVWRANTTPNRLADTIASVVPRDPTRALQYPNHARRAATLISGYPDWETVDG